MTIISEIPLRNFQFWSGGKDRAEKCTDEQLDEIESMMEDITPENGWTETEVNDFFWLEFDTIANWLGYKSEEYFDAGVTESDVQDAEDWFNCILNANEMIDIANLDRNDYIYRDEDGEYVLDEDLVYDDFSDWWSNMNDIEKVKEYRKYE